MLRKIIFISLGICLVSAGFILMQNQKRPLAPPRHYSFILPFSITEVAASTSAAMVVPASTTSMGAAVISTATPPTATAPEPPAVKPPAPDHQQGVERLTSQRTIYDDTQWPTDSRILSSAFGPRLMASENYRYDFHRGIDIPGKGGVDKVYAIADGEIFRTYEENDPDNPYKNGGTTIVIRHQADRPIPFHGASYMIYYSVYLHLDTILAPMGNNTTGPYPKVKKGDVIGVVGQTGATEFDHLHFEIRVGSHCSKEYQHAHPKSSCATVFTTPQDPHINPFTFLPYSNTDVPDLSIVKKKSLRVLVTLPRNELDFNTIRFIADDGTVYPIDLNTRNGINPDMDINHYNSITILPGRFNERSSAYRIEFEIETGDRIEYIEAMDVWGGGIRLTLIQP